MRYKKQKKAFTIVEVLIALAITAMLLTAVAVAFNASIKNYQENEKMFKTMNNARQAMLRMTAQLRTAGYYVVDSNDGVKYLYTVEGHYEKIDDANDAIFFPASPASPNNICNFYTPDGQYLTYEFRDASYANPTCRNKLYLIGNGNEYVLCDNVTGMNFKKEIDNSGGAITRIRVSISMTVDIGDTSQTVSSAAVIRRNLE